MHQDFAETSRKGCVPKYCNFLFKYKLITLLAGMYFGKSFDNVNKGLVESDNV